MGSHRRYWIQEGPTRIRYEVRRYSFLLNLFPRTGPQAGARRIVSRRQRRGHVRKVTDVHVRCQGCGTEVGSAVCEYNKETRGEEWCGVALRTLTWRWRRQGLWCTSTISSYPPTHLVCSGSGRARAKSEGITGLIGGQQDTESAEPGSVLDC